MNMNNDNPFYIIDTILKYIIDKNTDGENKQEIKTEFEFYFDEDTVELTEILTRLIEDKYVIEKSKLKEFSKKNESSDHKILVPTFNGRLFSKMGGYLGEDKRNKQKENQNYIIYMVNVVSLIMNIILTLFISFEAYKTNDREDEISRFETIIFELEKDNKLLNQAILNKEIK